MFCQALTFFCALYSYSCVNAVEGRLERTYRDINRVENDAVSGGHINGNFHGEPIVWIPDGGLRGFHMTSAKGRTFAAFQGIPFAQPPVGQLRFQEPRRNYPWITLRDAVEVSPTCLQVDFFQMYKILGQEDCLYINVYTPKIPAPGEPPLPVIVGFHFGGFFFGSANLQGPAYLLDEDVILVTMNYRLGAFGFLSTGDRIVPGNNGLKDQALALQWVRDNIGFFGGDHHRVTIMGESAGAGSVHYHMVSPLSRGLFHGAISQSGSAFCFWSINEKGTELSQRLGSALQCPITDSRALVKCLRSKNATDIVAVHPLLLEWAVYPVALWAPVIEPNLPGAFLSELPEESYRRTGGVAQVPWITGFNTDELAVNVATILGNPGFLNDFNTKWDELVGPAMMELPKTSENPSKTARIIRERYMGTADLTFDTRAAAVQMLDDRYMVTCGVKAMRYHSTLGNSPVYSYQFNFRGKYSFIQLLGLDPKDWGVAHIDDQIYFFNNTAYYPNLKPTDAEYNMSRIMITLWTNFAKYGEPFLLTESGEPIRLWTPNTLENNDENPKFLSLNLYPEMMENPYSERISFWENLNLHEGDNYYNEEPSSKINSRTRSILPDQWSNASSTEEGTETTARKLDLRKPTLESNETDIKVAVAHQNHLTEQICPNTYRA